MESWQFMNILKKCVVKQVKNWMPYRDSLHTLVPIKGKQYTLQLNYCPLVWMFCTRRSSNFINKVQERALCMTYNNQLTDFKSLLSNHNEITIHQRNLQVLMTEIYKIINHIAPPIMSSLFEIRENTHNTRYFQVLSNESRRTVNYGLETICYRAPFLWANLPPEYKLANSLNIFKRKIKNWKGENCPCRLCKTYVRELGYI